MSDFQTKASNPEEELNKELITQAEELLEQSIKADETFSTLLKTYWKDKKLIADISDSIHLNNETMKSLKNEIKDRNSRFIKK